MKELGPRKDAIEGLERAPTAKTKTPGSAPGVFVKAACYDRSRALLEVGGVHQGDGGLGMRMVLYPRLCIVSGRSIMSTPPISLAQSRIVSELTFQCSASCAGV